MSNLIAHAERELRLAGLFDRDSDYNGALGPAILRVVQAFADERPSGGMASVSIPVLEKLLRFENLTPITDDPRDWMDVSQYGPGPMWQCVRNHRLFSEDGGKIHYDVDDPNRVRKPTAPAKPQAAHDCDGADCCEAKPANLDHVASHRPRIKLYGLNYLQRRVAVGLKRMLPGAHYVDLRVRLNGKYRWFQADWLKDILARVDDDLDEVDYAIFLQDHPPIPDADCYPTPANSDAERYFANKVGECEGPMSPEAKATVIECHESWRKRIDYLEERNKHLREMLAEKNEQLVKATSLIERYERLVGRLVAERET